MVPPVTRPVIAIVGPTASGKTALGVELALRLGGEVVNADSMQLYRGMDIGTAKVTTAERRGVRHHLLDVWDVRRAASVEHYQRAARAAIADIDARGLVPILVGGSGLYVRAALDVMDFPGTDPALRAELEAIVVSQGPDRLHERLAELAPEAAARIPAANPRRVVRALEVVLLTGTFTGQLPAPTYVSAAVQIGLRLPREELVSRVERRIERMWAEGFVNEVRALQSHGLRDGVTARRALGYEQVLRMLDGEIDEGAARQLTVFATRRFVRRQDSWFGRDDRIRWVDPRDSDLVDRLSAELAPTVA